MLRHPVDREARGQLTALVAVAALLPLAVLGSATSASGFYLRTFRNCPVNNPGMTENGGLCLYARSHNTSEFAAGNAVVPLERSLVLQGGVYSNSEEKTVFVGPENGAPTLVPVGQVVPGGLANVIDPAKLSGAVLREFEKVGPARQKVTAVIELAGAPSAISFSLANLAFQEGTALGLPLKVRFKNDFLGENCLAGSDAAPIIVELTDGTTSPPAPNEPISGKLGTGRETHEGVIMIMENSLVNNSFAAPGVEGCGREPAWQEQVDAAIDAKVDLPAPAGHNASIITGALGAAESGRVKEHLGL